MSDFVRGSSSIFRMEAHLSFKVKYSHNVFDIVEFKQRCHELLLEAAAKVGVELGVIGFERNHVHMDAQWLKITLSVDKISKALKGTTGRRLLREFLGVKKKYFWGSGLWSPTIYGDSMGREPTQIREYIRNQGKKAERHDVRLSRFLTAIPPVY